MTISGIEIPEADVEKLQPRLKKMLYLLYEADPAAVTTWTLLKVGGAGVAQRRRDLKGWLEKYGLTLKKDYFGKQDSTVFIYWIQQMDMFTMRPKQIVGEVS